MVVAEKKRCPRCERTLPLDDFPIDRNGVKGRYGYCRSCKSSYMRDRHAAKSSEQVLQENLARRLRDFGITRDEYEALLAAQDGRCAICRSKEPGGKMRRFTLDHDHESGRLRGLLCWTCNTGLGAFRDSPTVLEAAAAYLLLHRA